MKKRILFFLLILSVISAGVARADGPRTRITVKGTVVDTDKLPVIGAYIVEEGNEKNGAISDADGRFSIIVADNASILRR